MQTRADLKRLLIDVQELHQAIFQMSGSTDQCKTETAAAH